MIRVFYHQLHHKWILAFYLISGNNLSIGRKQTYPRLLPQLRNICNGVAISFKHTGKLVRRNGDRPLHEFRNIIASEELTVIVGVGTRQFERLGAFP